MSPAAAFELLAVLVIFLQNSNLLKKPELPVRHTQVEVVDSFCVIITTQG
jgi:hypothetical protein